MSNTPRHPYYYQCPCQGSPGRGSMVDRDTYWRMVNNPLLTCVVCNGSWHSFRRVAVEDEPNTNEEFGDMVDTYEDLVVHCQGEEERIKNENL